MFKKAFACPICSSFSHKGDVKRHVAFYKSRQDTHHNWFRKTRSHLPVLLLCEIHVHCALKDTLEVCMKGKSQSTDHIKGKQPFVRPLFSTIFVFTYTKMIQRPF